MKAVDTLEAFLGELKQAGDKLVVVDFFATWCGPCRMIAPKLEKMAETYSDVIFLKVDVDEAEDIQAEYEIEAMPTFKFFKKEAVVGEVVGANDAKIEEQIKSLK